jgi:hypothetical protein
MTFCPYFIHFNPIWIKFGTGGANQTVLNAVSCIKIGIVKATFYLAYCWNLYPYFPHLLSDSDDNRYKRSAHNNIEHLWVSGKSAKGRPRFS